MQDMKLGNGGGKKSSVMSPVQRAVGSKGKKMMMPKRKMKGKR